MLNFPKNRQTRMAVLQTTVVDELPAYNKIFDSTFLNGQIIVLTQALPSGELYFPILDHFIVTSDLFFIHCAPSQTNIIASVFFSFFGYE